MNFKSKNILVAPLNWGLGHATRCIPIIKELETNGYTPILASDGDALELLKNEFPHLKTLPLPSYKIKYAAKGKNLKWKLLAQSPALLETILSEKKVIKQWVKEYQLHGIISDNRLGVYSKKIPSVYITHQTNILSGHTKNHIMSAIHKFFIKKFDECWIPDYEKRPNLSGLLSHPNNKKLNLKYIGPLSRFKKIDLPIQYDLTVVLSGPEPQRSILEDKIREELNSFDGKVIFIRGVVESESQKETIGKVTFCNFLTASELETILNQSKKILCRSGYSTLMDLVVIGKPAFLIPTPGQPEQEYLAKKMKREGRFPHTRQDLFKMEHLHETQLYNGFQNMNFKNDWNKLFHIFDRFENSKHQSLTEKSTIGA